MPLPMTPAPSTPTVFASLIFSRLGPAGRAARSYVSWLQCVRGQVDAREPEAGRLELRCRGNKVLVGPEAIEPVETGTLDHARAKRVAERVVVAAEAEQRFDELTRFASFDAVPLHRFVDLRVRRHEPARDALEDRVGVALEHGGEHAQPLLDRILRGRPHRAEQLFRLRGERLECLRVPGIEI